MRTDRLLDILGRLGARTFLELTTRVPDRRGDLDPLLDQMLVGDVMPVPAVTIGADAGSGTIWVAFSHTRGRRMPVVDAQGRLQGVLARKDFLEALPLKMR